ncbi:membrane protein [Sorangium cellulosum]|uniref:Membrane protein n=1 Tax=Sorangium cellulosum TaxID=56 RepID=A0A4P2QB35_SORCE|nr:hypothetical protein [Sorangium cellulosum]AUX26506.1 membrane protein [Sorangium cellulosum]
MANAIEGYLIGVYGAYAAISVGLTIWIARTLFRSGAVFLEDVFADSPRMAEAVNRLLVVGFYLVNLGYASLILKADGSATITEAIEVLSSKLGLLLLSLALMHFANLLVFHRIRRRAKLAVLPPPVAPQMRLDPRAGDAEDEMAAQRQRRRAIAEVSA